MKTLLLAALGGALLAAPAAAQIPVQPEPVQTVSYSDLDLRTDAGRAALDRRIAAAVIEACGTASSADPQGQNEVRRCRAETLDSVAAKRDTILAAARANGTVLASQ